MTSGGQDRVVHGKKLGTTWFRDLIFGMRSLSRVGIISVHKFQVPLLATDSFQMPSTQKALLLKQKYAELVVDEVEIYEPGPGEILIKIQAAALNPIDWKIHKWGVFIEGFPAILGTDIAGDVEKVGPGVEDFEVGNRVYVQHNLSDT